MKRKINLIFDPGELLNLTSTPQEMTCVIEIDDTKENYSKLVSSDKIIDWEFVDDPWDLNEDPEECEKAFKDNLDIFNPGDLKDSLLFLEDFFENSQRLGEKLISTPKTISRVFSRWRNNFKGRNLHGKYDSESIKSIIYQILEDGKNENKFLSRIKEAAKSAPDSLEKFVSLVYRKKKDQD